MREQASVSVLTLTFFSKNNNVMKLYFWKHHHANWGQQSQSLPQHKFKSKKMKEETYSKPILEERVCQLVAHKSAIVDEVDGGF